MEITKDEDIAKSINEYFANVGTRLKNQLKDKGVNPMDNMKKLKKPSKDFKFQPTTIRKVKKVIANLQPKTSASFDRIPNKLLKILKNEIAGPLTIVINKCLESGVMPEPMKLARVIYLHKGGPEYDMGNYRPISLLPTLSKILEKIFTQQFQSHMEDNDLWCETQFGFREGRGTIQALSASIKTIESLLNKKQYVALTALDVAKAFNALQKEVLLEKLPYYGINGTEKAFFKSFLSDRKQMSYVNGVYSEEVPIDMGIPQGGTLSAPIYIAYNNDLEYSSDMLTFLYADDSMLINSAPTIEQLEQDLNRELDKVSTWFNANQLTLNEKKTQYIIFVPKSKPDKEVKIELNKVTIERIGKNYSKKSAKLLGILVDDRLTFEEQAKKVISKIRTGYAKIAAAKHQLPKKCKIMAYNALIKPHLEYGALIWGPKLKDKWKKQIDIIQKKCVRIIDHLHYNEHTGNSFRELKIMKFKDLIQLAAIKLAWGIYTEEAPKSLWHENREKNQRKIIDKHRVPERGFPGQIVYEITSAWNKTENEWKDLEKIMHISHRFKKQTTQSYETNCTKNPCRSCEEMKKRIARREKYLEKMRKKLKQTSKKKKKNKKSSLRPDAK